MNKRDTREAFTTRNAVIGLFAFFLLGVSNPGYSQQNIQSSQYVFNAISINPAYAGYKEDWYLQIGHRMQWLGLQGYGNDGNGAPVTTSLAVDGLTDFQSKNMGLGIQMTSDKLGPQSVTSLYGNYSYRLKLDAVDLSRLCLGLGIGLTQYNTDASMLRPVDVDDPSLTYENTNSYIPDVRFGIYYYNPNFYLGFSAMDLLAGTKSEGVFSKWVDSTLNVVRSTHLYVMGGALLELTDYTRIRPNLTVREDFKGPTNIDMTVLFVFDNRFWLGGSYRFGYRFWKKYDAQSEALNIPNAVVGLVNFQINDRIRMGYSYDVAINSLSGAQYGTHELTLGWLLSKRSRRVLSPRFF